MAFVKIEVSNTYGAHRKRGAGSPILALRLNTDRVVWYGESQDRIGVNQIVTDTYIWETPYSLGLLDELFYADRG